MGYETKKNWQIYLFSKGNKKELENFLIFLRLLLFLISNFWCFAQTGTQKNAIPIKKKDKQMQPHHPQSRGNGTTISAKLVYALLCYSWFYPGLSHKIFMHFLWAMHSILKSLENLNNCWSLDLVWHGRDHLSHLQVELIFFFYLL